MHAKGSLFVHARAFVTSRGGVPAWSRLVTALPEGDRAVLEALVLTGAWYPVGAWNRLVARHGVEHGARAVEDLARYVGAADMHALFKLVLKLGSPETVLQRTPWLFGRYFSAGALTASAAGARRWQLALQGPRGEDDGPGAFVCAHGVPGWISQAMQLTGARDAAVAQTHCRFRGAAACLFDATW